MKKIEKLYVGKGSMPQSGMDIIRISLKMELLNQLVYEFEGVSFVTLEVSRLKEPDQFNRTHTVYGSVLKEEDPPAPKKRARN